MGALDSDCYENLMGSFEEEKRLNRDINVIKNKEHRKSFKPDDIIHCINCIHYQNHHLCLHWSKYGTIETKAEDFCSYGERI